MRSKTKGAVRRYIVTPDKHVPYQDRAAWNCVLKAISIVKPDGYIDLGDFIEGEAVSHWAWKKKKRPPLDYQLIDVDNEIRIANGYWDQIDEALDKVNCKDKVFTQGNHDEWMDRLVEENPHLERTKHGCGPGYLFKDAFNLKGRGYTFVPAGEMHKIGRLHFYHGHLCRSGVTSARWHVLHMGVNVMYGHFHDVQEASIGHVDGRKGVWSIGCLKSFEHEHGNQFMRRHPLNWCHAFAVVDFYDDGLFTTHVVRIINGKCSLWGELIDGNKKV